MFPNEDGHNKYNVRRNEINDGNLGFVVYVGVSMNQVVKRLITDHTSTVY